jgi:hypothetical protein
MCTQKVPSKKMVGVPRYDRRRYLWGKIVSKLEQQLHFRPPRSSPQLVDGARGARNCVPKRVKWREEPLRPLLPRCADLCPCHFLLPPRVPTLRPVLLPKCQKARPALLPKCQKARPCCLRPGRQTTVADAVNSRAPTQPTHIALALRSKTSPTFVLAWQRNRSANNGMLLPHHISPPILAPPCSCFASAYRIRLRQRCLIIATRPRPVCSESTVVPLSPLDRIPV